MRKSILLFVLFALLNIPLMLFAQSGYKVKGHVVSAEDNEPMVGVSILEKGTTNGVITDIDGNYTLEIKGTASATLLFSYIGMQSQAHEVSAKTGTLNVRLVSDAALIDEVVVVAYGTRKKGTIAGAVSTVKAEKLENVPAAGFDQSLQGQTPGLSVISNSGEPSKAAVFQIRGTNSINSGTSPLFILDGVPISSADFNTISPGDIESISVLKDASSTSIYGARAANGVVVITSKRGLAMDKAKVTLRGQWGFSQLASGDNWMMMNTPERIQFEKEIGLDTGKDYNLLSRTDINWLDKVFNDRAPLQSYELSVNRATDRLNYYVSGGFYDQDGIAQSSTFRRYNMRANAEVKASNWLKIGTNTMMAYEEIAQAEEGDMALYTPISGSRFMLPYWNPYNADGSLASENDGTWKGTGQNPIDWALKAKNRDIFNYIRTLIALRKKHPAFRIPTAEGLEKWLHFLDTGDSGVIAYTLGEYANGDEWKEILVAYNGNRNQADINIPEQDWIIVCHNGQIDLDSQEHLSGGDISVTASSALILYRQ